MGFSIIDFLIGLFLMNAMPHFVLGIYKGRMLSLFGFGDKQNLMYSFFNFALAMGLFIYKYGLVHLFYHEFFLGALLVLLSYYILGKYLYHKFHVEHYNPPVLEEENH